MFRLPADLCGLEEIVPDTPEQWLTAHQAGNHVVLALQANTEEGGSWLEKEADVGSRVLSFDGGAMA